MDLSKVKRSAVLAEFVGTFMLTLAVLASLYGALPLTSTVILAAVVIGAIVLMIGATSGAHINPALTLGLFLVKKVESATAVSYIVAQVSGALVAMAAMSLFQDGQLVQTLPAETDFKTFAAETLGAGAFGFGVAAAVYSKAKDVAAGLMVGGSFFVGGVLATIASSAILNPAVAVGVSSYSWPYLVGPAVGAIIGMQLYDVISKVK